MQQWIDGIRKNPRLAASILVPAILLVALVIATGNPFSNGSNSSPAPSGSGNGNTNPPPPAPLTHDAVQGKVAVQARRLSSDLWRFVYTVHNTGKTPIAGFQLNGPPANLYALSLRRGWGVFGSGVCGGKYADMLVYWSTGSASPSVIQPAQSASFSFELHTSGAVSRLYSLSFGQAAAQFGQVSGPASSAKPATGRCKP